MGVLLALVGWNGLAAGHEIPGDYFERSIQLTLEADAIRIDYQLDLESLTYFRTLREVTGGLPVEAGRDHRAWFAEHWHRQIARGCQVRINGRPVEVRLAGTPTIEPSRHETFVWPLRVPLPAGQTRFVLEFADANFQDRYGGSRLALQSTSPAWQLDECTVPALLEGIERKDPSELSPDEERQRLKLTARWQRAAVTDATADASVPRIAESQPAESESRLTPPSLAVLLMAGLVALAIGLRARRVARVRP